MKPEIFTFEQGTPEWVAARLGVPTASMFSAVLAEGRKGSESKTRRTYAMKLIGEQLTGDQMYHYENDHMERGHAQEDTARQLYVFARDVEVQKVGFVRRRFGKAEHHVAGCSPDSLVGDKGLLEIKTKLAHLQAEVLLAGELPSEHVAQVQGQLWIAERDWCDFVSYCPKMPPFIKRVHRDEVYIARLAKAVEIFCNEMMTLKAGILEAA